MDSNTRLSLADLSEDELTDLIDEATRRREQLRAAGDREAKQGPYGSKGQDVRDPHHGAIAAPTPNEVEKVGPAHGIDDQPPRQARTA